MTITLGTAQVTIRPNNGGFYSVMTVNAGQTVLAGKGHDTQIKAERWANRMLTKHAA